MQVGERGQKWDKIRNGDKIRFCWIGIHFGFVDSTEVENKIEESEFEVYSEYHNFDHQVLKLELNIEFFF